VATFASTHVAQNAVNFALATSTVDTALLLDICAGPDLFDRTSLPVPDVSYLDAVRSLPTDGLRVAYSPCFGFGPIEREVGEVVTAALDRLVQIAGLNRADIDVELPFFFETYSKLEGVDRWIDLPDGLWPDRADELGPELQAGWESGHRARLPQLGAVYTARRALEHQVAALFTEIDVLVTPTTGVAAFAAEGPLPDSINGQTVHQFVGLAQPILASICNLPAMSLPAGSTSDGRPVGLQVIAHRFREDVCLRLAQLLEEATGQARPPGHLGAFGGATPQ
jgi:aspartyl-tRNA(Asn)/glutamyl-tRNA(Gln) amidotransferase subunit A